MNNLLVGLNEQQQKAVEICDRPLRVIAGAGSGKTRVITTKIAYLVQHHKIPAHKILAVTFTNKAAREMKERVQKLLNNHEQTPFISTFHAFCARILREDYQPLGLIKNFSIIDTTDQKTIIRRLIKQNNLNSEKNFIKLEKELISKISQWKNSLNSPQEILDSVNSLEERQFAEIYKLYQQYLKEQNFVDFDDLQVYVFHLFQKNPDILKKWQQRFAYLLVDEFQDTNNLQFDLIKFLTKEQKNLTVVGDPDQTIYSWRGARAQIILNFQKNFPDAISIVLSENYRSTQQILDIANDFIAHNKTREKKVIFTKNPSGLKAQVKECASRYSEAKYVAKEIEKLVKTKNYKYSDFFILYRMNSWSQEFEKTLTNAKIPFQLIGGIRFRERRVIKDAIAFLKVLVTKDELSMERILKLTPKIGAVTIEKLQDLGQKNNVSLFEIVTGSANLSLKVTKYLGQLRETLIGVQELVQTNQPVEKIAKHLLTKSGYLEIVRLLDDEEHSDENNIKAFFDQLKHFDEEFDSEIYGETNYLRAFLQEEALNSNEDEEFQVNRVSLLTVHSAKGLENKVVFVVGLNRDIFPSKRSMMSIQQLEEERRALYVAMTRAQEHLYLTFVRGEYSHLVGGLLTHSPFIRELDPDLYDYERNIFAHHDGQITSEILSSNYSTKNISTKNALFQKGDLVNHILFGDGVVIEVLEFEYKIAFNNPKFGVQHININNQILRKK